MRDRSSRNKTNKSMYGLGPKHNASIYSEETYFLAYDLRFGRKLTINKICEQIGCHYKTVYHMIEWVKGRLKENGREISV